MSGFLRFFRRSQAGMLGADAQAILATALGRTAVQIDRRALRESAFLILYCGEFGAQIVDFAMEHKIHQAPFAGRGLRDSLQALALREFMSKVSVNLGGK